MQNKKILLYLLSLLLIVSISIPIATLPLAGAHTPPWKLPTHAYISVAPNPVGVGQEALIIFWMDRTIQGTALTNEIRYHNYELTITAPDGTTQTQKWDTVWDTTTSQYYPFTPTQPGTYTLKFTFPGQIYTYGGAYQNDEYLPSSAETTLTVQEQPILGIPDTPLPSEYWSRPIEGQNTLWQSISSNWLGGAASADVWQKDGSAPKSAHIMWTKPVEFGGLTGGLTDEGSTFYSGFSYETRFGNPIIIGGVLYYRQPLNHAGSGGEYCAVDLQTGETIWSRDDISPSKAQLFNFDNPNQHGVVGGTLWETSGSTWYAYDAFTGKAIFNLTNVPSGTEVYTDDGQIVRYVLNYNNRWLALWNWTASPDLGSSTNPYRPTGKSINTSSTYTWNVTIPNLPGSASPSIIGILHDDLILGRSSNVALTSLPRETPDPYTLWAINLDPTRGAVGSLLWIKNYAAPAGNITRMLAWQPIDPVYRTFTMTDFETGQRLGYSLDTGDLLWGPVGDFRAFQYYSSRAGFPAYGNLYVTGYGGEIKTFSMNNGTLLWTFNDTSSGIATPWGQYPIQGAAAADGMIFVFAGEHSPNTPLYEGYRVYAVDAFTGKEVWNLPTWSASGLGTSLAPVAIADGHLVFLNAYDGKIYSIGKGPSALTVDAPKASIEFGKSLVISGTVTDISAGTKQEEQSARFPHGVPVVSDESQTAWMEYIYQQKPCPTNATGVTVTLNAIDANGNYRTIGTTTTDATGFYSYQWTPDIEGKYTVYASFAGSDSYWPSSATTAFAVDPAQATSTPHPTVVSMADQYFLPMSIGTIVAVIVIGALLALLLLRRRP